MAKFKLKPVDDFKLPIDFNMPNGEQARVVFTVKHKRAKEIGALFSANENEKPSDEAFVMNIATGWDLEEEFNADNVKEAVDFFPGMVIEFTRAYMNALAGVRAKN
jgi:hypothetical protein